MSRGQVLYHGRSQNARPWLTAEAGVSMPASVNTPDVLIEVASYAAVSKPEKKTKELEVSALEVAGMFAVSDQLASIKQTIQTVRSEDRRAIRLLERNRFVQWFVEVGAVCFRSFRNSMRNPLSFTLVLIIQALMGCLLGAIFYKLPDQYLPAEMPPDIGSEQSNIMYAFNNSFAVFMQSGIDGSGYNPLLELLVSGVDGQMSEPFVTLADGGVLQLLYNSMDCVHEKMELDRCYPSVDFSEYFDLWGTSSEGDDAWAGGSDFSAPILTSYLLKDLQVLDYALAKFDYDNIMRLIKPLEGVEQGAFILIVLPCYTAVRELAYAFSGCSGVATLPTRYFHKLDGSSSIGGFCSVMASFPTGDPAVKPAFSCESRDVSNPRGEQAADWEALADRGGRRLQAAAVISGSADDMKKALPPVLAAILERLPEYQTAFSECPHEFCRLLQEQLSNADGSAGQLNLSLAALADYGAVLGAIMNVVGALFFSIANVGFASYDALVSFPQERVMINREMANYAYKPSSYFVGKTIADMTFQLAPSMLLVITFYFLIGVEAGDHAVIFWRYLGICALSVFSAYGFAYLASALSPSMEVAVVSAPVVLVIFLCCSGFFVRDVGIPDWLTWVKYLSFYRWGFFALILNQFPLGKSYGGVPNSFSLAVAGINEHRISVCCGALVALGLGFRFLAYLALRFIHRRVGIE
eukprot:Gregarina_sp_Pseudo_9__2149@NODE_24_length_5670_cov_13_762742_g22_i0_p2_GENE_NODE_24_length_5670_cov_13_762742_g22_i0NODE_24_length_5670_cov_13_762742_g22_i0_p2_ORF_typecomplete_len695_score196_30ABC2_membrane/PF01061_24/0_011ABC2_membrane/PF01061_24/1_3e29ABC2_membrane_3/PF12698_7/1_7e07CcmB/PF03379_13/4_7e03CcmB/PF03379_13/0_00036ABC2_membrane_2/PF12679_7/1_2e03ABC2_membrane_2/PF12679_7/1_7e03ABC2_membrane_2/PF12679_7/0_0044DUF4590/PF15257_6/0_11_NODE_24_length_5670_cov_13_762742_g22_i03232407